VSNTLYYGDREHFPDQSIDLVYLDPPFNSNASDNVSPATISRLSP
jgi:site-specific DNA-methyltransferase (adenine-specific)